MVETTQESNRISESKNYIKMISDPIRSRIMIETLLRGEITAKDLLNILEINRGAISYHLGLMVENNILTVKVDEKGRPVKRYSLYSNDILIKFEELMEEATEEDKKELLLAKLHLYAGTMQMISNLAVDAVKHIPGIETINDVKLLNEQIVNYKMNNTSEFFIPLLFKFLSRKQIDELVQDFVQMTIKKISSLPTVDSKSLMKDEKFPYLLMFTCFPLLHLGKKI